jgi:hypothetical protein
MRKNLPFVLAAILAMPLANTAQAAVFMIGDNDGYGQGIPDGADAPFTSSPLAYYDGRSEAEKADTDGAQFTDTYSTTHPSFSPHDGTLATFVFSGIGDSLKNGKLEVDMAEFEASRYGPVAVSFNGITQVWDFDDGFGHTKVRDFSLDRAVLDSINASGELVVMVDRNGSDDFYGFDYIKLTTDTNVGGGHIVAPIPAALWLFASALAGLGRFGRRSQRG